MTGKVLITYSTGTGSIKGVAECIREKLSDLGENADIAPMMEVTDLSQYRAVFAGTLDIKRIPTLTDKLKFRISVLFGVWKEGDHRDLDSIKNWAKDLKVILDSTN